MSGSEAAPVRMPSEVTDRVGIFDRFAEAAARVASRASFFASCVLLIVLWAPSYFLIGKVDADHRRSSGDQPNRAGRP